MSEKYGFSGWVWILAAVIVVGFMALGSRLIQTQQRLRAVEIELGGAKEETGRARAGAAELAKVVENLRLELKAANTALNEYQGKLDKANATIAELSKKLDTAQADLGKQQSQLQDMEAELKYAKQLTPYALSQRGFCGPSQETQTTRRFQSFIKRKRGSTQEAAQAVSGVKKSPAANSCAGLEEDQAAASAKQGRELTEALATKTQSSLVYERGPTLSGRRAATSLLSKTFAEG